MMPDPGQPPDPLSPRDPIIITPRRRPVTVGLARGMFLAGSVLGLASGVTMLIGSRMVVEEFWYTAARALIEPAQIAELADVIRTVLASTGVVALVLALGMGFCAVRLGRARRGARTGALVFTALSLCFGLGSASFTSLARGVDWAATIQPESVAGQDAALRDRVGQAYGDAMPGLLVGTTGGLTDLQALGYISGAALLLAPASRPHFRRRQPPAPVQDSDDPDADPTPPAEPEAVQPNP